MILSSLYQYYEILSSDSESDICSFGFCEGKISFSFNISQDGDILDVIPLYEVNGRRKIAKRLKIPEQKKRAYGIDANFLCDNCAYVLGLTDEKEPQKIERAKNCFYAMKQLHEEILGNLNDVGAQAIIHYFKRWSPNDLAKHPKIRSFLEDLLEGGNIVFQLDRDKGFIHERPAIREAWLNYKMQNQSEINSQCLITGKQAPIARLHGSIKGVDNAQSTGASLVSFNKISFESYGKEQSYNAPVSEEATFAYVTALNYLLNNQRQRLRVGDATVVFWALKPKAKLEETLLGELLNPSSPNTLTHEIEEQNTLTQDIATARLIRDILKCVREGRPIREGVTEVDPEVNFCILGLSPNNARLAVRFFHRDSFGHLAEQIARHHTDISVYRTGRTEEEIVPIGRVLRETAPQGKEDKIPPLLGGALMRAILMGLPYPDNLYHAIIGRIRADQDDPERRIYKVNAVRAGLVKGYLLRKARWRKDKDLEAMLTMGLNEQSTNTAYLLGRLFALLEKAQKDAAGTELNATIKDRYFGAASATPKAVFPLLLRLAQHHLAKAESGRYRDKQIEEVLSKINSFPAYLNLEEQGLFVLGYYHQREALYTKKEEKEG